MATDRARSVIDWPEAGFLAVTAACIALRAWFAALLWILGVVAGYALAVFERRQSGQADGGSDV